MTEYSPWPGTLRSNTREDTDEPCTKKSTGRAGSPGFGSPTRLRYTHSGISPFFAQYSLLQISPAGAVSAAASCASSAPAIPPRGGPPGGGPAQPAPRLFPPPQGQGPRP